MDTMEYIKMLEQRIEALEKFISTIKLDNKENITFTDCQIQAIGLEKCQGVSMTDMTVENLGFAAFQAKIENATIHNFSNSSGKVKVSNCTIHNHEQEEDHGI